jgi:hypothetical protein
MLDGMATPDEVDVAVSQRQVRHVAFKDAVAFVIASGGVFPV